MQLEQFRYANEIAKCGSITQAARNLYISQPSLTIAIRKLETELGFALFTRSTKGIKVTPLDEEALATIGQILALTEDLATLSPEWDQAPASVQLVVFPTLYDLLDDAFYAEIQSRHPQLSCEIIEQTVNTILQEVAGGALNFAICGGPSPLYYEQLAAARSAKASNTAFRILYEEPLLLLLPRNHPFLQIDTIHMDQLQNETFLYFGEHLRHHRPNILEGYNFQFKEILPFYRRTSIMKAIARGQGVSILPESQFREEPAVVAGQVCARAIDDFHNTYLHYLVYNKRHIFTKIENELLALIDAFYSAL